MALEVSLLLDCFAEKGTGRGVEVGIVFNVVLL
jgi:hypothetical protein